MGGELNVGDSTDLDLDLDEELDAEEDLDDLDAVDGDAPQADRGLRDVATSLGVDPSSYTSEQDLTDAINLRIGAMNRGELTPKEKKEVEFATVKFHADDPDKVLGSELHQGMGNLEKAVNENFAKVAVELKNKSSTSSEVTGTLKKLQEAITTLNKRSIQLTMDNWLARRSDTIRDYFGTESMGELDPDGIHARRRDALEAQAGRAATKVTKAGRSYTLEKMFATGMKQMKHFKTTSKSTASRSRERVLADDGEGTALARAAGTKGKDYGDTDNGTEALKRRAADVVSKHLRNQA